MKIKVKAFSILEIVVVMTMLVVVAVSVMPFAVRSVSTVRADEQAKQIASLLSQYQQNAYSGLDNLAYGVRFNTNSYDIYNGSNYTSASFKQNILLGDEFSFSNISLSDSGNEIVFLQGTFRPNAYGSITISGAGAQSATFTINFEGMIDY